MSNRVAATVSRFAAAMGIIAAEDPKDDEKDDDKTDAKPPRLDGESDEDYDKRCEDDKKEKEAAAAKAKTGADDKKDEDEKKEAAAVARGAVAERKRWEAVLSAPEAANRGATACAMLADTELSADQIKGVLKTTPEMKGASGLAARMAAAVVPAPTPAASEAAAPGSAQATAAAINAAAALARGETPKAA